MGTYLLGDIVDSIEDTLSAAASLARSQSYDELSEGMQDYPTLQVWPGENPGTSLGSETHKKTLRFSSGIGHSVKEYVIYADLFARQRSHVAEDMAQLVETITDLEDILDTQSCPPFGNDNIMDFKWRWEHVTFDYGGVLFAGARFYITVRCGTI